MSKEYQPQKSSANPSKFSKHHLRADGLLLLSSALRSCLGRRAKPLALGAVAIQAGSITVAQGVDVFAESLTLTIPSTPLSLDVTPTDEGQFSESNLETVSVETDSLAGYTLTIKSKNDNNDLTNSGGDKITSIGEKKATGDAFDPNTWGYRPSKFNSSINTDYQPGPKSSPDTIDAIHAKSDGKTDYTIQLGAKVDTTIPYGNYSNTFVLTATTNATHYTVTYYDNADGDGTDKGEDAVTGMPNDVPDGTTYETTVEVANGNPTYDGHKFLGWCDTVPTKGEDEKDTCSGTAYGSSDDATMAAANGNTTWTLTGATNTLNLYAMWEEDAKQNQTANFECSSLSAVGQTGTITDDRDGNTYTVTKLADGLCWLTQNLRLGDEKLENRILTSDNADLPNGKTYTLPDSSTSGFSDSSAENVYVDASTSNISYGGYYTYNAATAGTGNDISSGDAIGSICPKGWRLPTKDEFGVLVSAYAGGGFTNLGSAPANFVRAGFRGSDATLRGDDGFYWSSTASSSTTAHHLYFYYLSANVLTEDRKIGFPVRCVAREQQ